MREKLSRREAQLIAHARRRAVEDYKSNTMFRLEVCPPGCAGPLTLRQFNLAQMEALNILSGEPVYFLKLYQAK